MNSFAAVPKFRYNVLLTLSDSVLQTLGEISKKKKIRPIHTKLLSF